MIFKDNSRLVRWLISAVVAMSTAWAGWVTHNITTLHEGQSNIQSAIYEINGKLSVIVDILIKHASK